MCKYKWFTKVYIIHCCWCQLASECIGQVKITSSRRDRECDRSDMSNMSSPHTAPHASHPNIIGKPNSSHYPGRPSSTLEVREQMVLPNICNNDGEVKMRNCNPGLLHFKCILAQLNIIWSAMCNVFKKKYLVLWSPKCLVTPSQVRPRPHRY